MADLSLFGGTPRQYKDLSLTFSLNPVTNDVLTLTGEDAVKRAIRTLLLTQAGEVPFFPDFGSKVSRYLFEPVDPIVTEHLRQDIRATIEAYEPRAKIVTLTVTPSEDEHQYQIDLVLQVVNLVQPVTLTLYLTRLR